MMLIKHFTSERFTTKVYNYRRTMNKLFEMFISLQLLLKRLKYKHLKYYNYYKFRFAFRIPEICALLSPAFCKSCIFTLND